MKEPYVLVQREDGSMGIYAVAEGNSPEEPQYHAVVTTVDTKHPKTMLRDKVAQMLEALVLRQG